MSAIPVYVGRWTDWSHGKVLGDSVTVSENDGKYIISALATFISIVAGSTWGLVAYLIHQLRVPRSKANALYRQQQITFRNSKSPISTVLELFCLAFVRRDAADQAQRIDQRKPSEHIRRETMRLMAYPIIVWAAFTIAGVLSSNIAKPAYKSSNIRVAEKNCGIWVFDISTQAGQYAHDRKVLNDTIAGRSYARSCYSKDFGSPNTITCSFYSTQSLPYTSHALDSQCPFGPNQSSSNLGQPFRGGECDIIYNSGSHMMSTNLLDSETHLGINAPPSDRVQFQKMVTCSPITLTNRTKIYGGDFCSSNINCSRLYTEYDFGPISGLTDYTYLYNPDAPQDNVGYQIK
jgi:hypothetical protein